MSGNATLHHAPHVRNMNQPTLKIVQERKLKELLPGIGRLEASGVVAWDNHYYVVFDNFPKIARIKSDLTRGKAKEIWANKNGKGSGFEDIAYDKQNKRFYTVVEALETTGKKFKGKIHTFDTNFRLLHKNWVNVKFESENKGFEGLEHVRRGKKDYVLALCEGNKCRGGKQGKTPGGGRIHVVQKDGEQWIKIHTINLPKPCCLRIMPV